MRTRKKPHELVAFLVLWADRYARECGLNGLHPTHYDLMVKYGCRMDDFKRATNVHREAQAAKDKGGMRWILREDGSLCLSGYPIRITVARGLLPFRLKSDFHGNESPHFTLESAKKDAARLSREIDEFTHEETEAAKEKTA